MSLHLSVPNRSHLEFYTFRSHLPTLDLGQHKIGAP